MQRHTSRLRWFSNSGNTPARGSLIQFSLSKLLPGETVTGVRLIGGGAMRVGRLMAWEMMPTNGN